MDRLSYGFLLEDMFRGMWIATESMFRPKVCCAPHAPHTRAAPAARLPREQRKRAHAGVCTPV
jgi:hypothetical protein